LHHPLLPDGALVCIVVEVTHERADLPLEDDRRASARGRLAGGRSHDPLHPITVAPQPQDHAPDLASPLVGHVKSLLCRADLSARA
jgi:hypothetical protein